MKVIIEKSDQGQFSVGTEQGEDIGSLMEPGAAQGVQPGAAMSPGADGMQPAADIEDALDKARVLLGGAEVEQQQAQQAFASV